MAEEVRAPLAGNIWKVLVEAGAKVEEDDELVIIDFPDDTAFTVETGFGSAPGPHCSL